MGITITKDRWIGRPNEFLDRDGQRHPLPVLDAFMASRAKRQILVAHRRGRKTTKALEKMFQYLWANPGIVGKTLAPIRKQAKEIIWDDPDMLFHPNVCNPNIISKVNHSELKVTLKNGSLWSLDGMDDPQSKRGGNAKVVHFTEAGDHEEAGWSQIYEPILTANNGVAIFEGNPRGRNWYYRLFNNAVGREGWERFYMPAARLDAQGRLEPLTPIFTLEQLQDLRSHNPDAVFRAEYLCEWVDSVGTVFRNFERLAIAQPEKARKGRRYRMGVDLAKLQDFTVLTVVDRHEWREVAIDRFNQIDWTLQKERIKAMAKEYGAKENGNKLEVLIESNGVGDPIFDDLWKWAASDEVRKAYDITFTPFRTTNETKAMIVSNLSMLFDEGIITILPDPVALRELSAFAYKKSSLHFIYGAPDGEHDDTVMSKALAFWELGAKLPEPIDNDKPQHKWGLPLEAYKNRTSHPLWLG
jgi:hypothetical protein